MSDQKTIDIYNQQAEEYLEMVKSMDTFPGLTVFIDALKPGDYVLDFGCGPATSSAEMRANGLQVDPVDASPAMVTLANESFQINARLGSFNDLSAVSTYEGVWASFSLLHATEEEFPTILSAIYKALKPAGVFHIGMKVGRGSKRDNLGRFYTFYSEQELIDHLTHARFTVISTDRGETKGLAGTADKWITVLSAKSS